METKKFNIFELLALNWLAVSAYSLVLAIIGSFTKPLLITGIIVLLIVNFLSLRSKNIIIEKLEKKEKVLMGILIAVALFLSHFSTPTVFEGRDEGSYSSAAIMLAQEGSLKYKDQTTKEFSKIYGKEGVALNFPGYYYTQDRGIKSQFLPGYISWIGTFYSLGGLGAIKYVNFIPFIVLIFSFYSVAKNIWKPKTALFLTAFLTSSFPLLIFYKFTLSETYFAALCWLTAWFVFRYFKEKSHFNFSLLALPMILMVFSRIEALPFIFMLIFIFILKDFSKFRLPRYQLIFIITGLAFLLSLIINTDFYIDTAKNIVPISGEGKIKEAAEISSTFLSDDWENLFLPKVLFSYNIIAFIVFSIFGVCRLFKCKKNLQLIPFFFFLPSLAYLYDANISLDHPWMLRRLSFSVIPLVILYSGFIFDELIERKKDIYFALCHILAAIIIIQNLFLFLPFATFSQNKNLLDQTQVMASYFGPNDLILVSKESSGNGWSLISSPLRLIFDKQAVYFFNPHDLKKIHRDDFDHIYLISSIKDGTLYDEIDKKPVTEYTLDYQIILPSKKALARPQIEPIKINGTIYQIK